MKCLHGISLATAKAKRLSVFIFEAFSSLARFVCITWITLTYRSVTDDGLVHSQLSMFYEMDTEDINHCVVNLSKMPLPL